MGSRYYLPAPSLISPADVSFLNEELGTEEQLNSVARLVTELESQCFNLDNQIEDINSKFDDALHVRASSSHQINDLFADIFATLASLRTSTFDSESDGDGDGLRRAEHIFGEELPALAKEVSRIETVRAYAETALKLDVLVGEIEDAAASSVSTSPRLPPSSHSQELHSFIQSVKKAEEVLIPITSTNPHWTRMISAVDGRVDRALAIVRPQAISHHRTLLSHLGWPPPLSVSRSPVPDSSGAPEPINPLAPMGGSLDPQYGDSFLSLCSLQRLQWQRSSRQLQGHNRKNATRPGLWAMEELVNPISAVCHRHFSKWIEAPHFMFALVYRIVRDYFDPLDELLQPLVDRARLSGYSSGEEWVSAMVSFLSVYTAEEVIPGYAGRVVAGPTGVPSPASAEWLRLVDSMASLERSVQDLLEHSGIPLEDEGDLRRVSLFSVFCDRPDWLELWARIERGDALETLRSEMEDPRNWRPGKNLGNPEAPAISGAVVQLLSALVDRSRLLPGVRLRAEFLAGTGAAVVEEFAAGLLLRCQEAEGLTALAEDRSLIEVASCLNAAYYFEQVVREWYDEVEGPGGGLAEGLGRLEELREEWVGKAAGSVVRGFGAKCTEYLKSRKRSGDAGGGGAVSGLLLDGLDHLQGRCLVMEAVTNWADFTRVWRRVADGADRVLFGGLFAGKTKWNDSGVERVGRDMEVVFGIFGRWCLRPEGFFGKVSEALMVLRTEDGPVAWDHGFGHLTPAEVDRIFRNRVFSGGGQICK